MAKTIRTAIKLLLLVPLIILTSIGASDSDYDIVIARLQYQGGGDWYNDPDVIPNLAKEINRRTSLRVAVKQEVVSPSDPAIFAYPIVYITGHGNIKFSDEDVKNLRRYLENGGFLYADDDYGMDESFTREIKKVFPDKQLVEIPFDNPIYHIFYQFPMGLPKIHEHYKGPPHGYGIFYQGRMVVFYTYNTNISDGWTPNHNDPPEKREQAFRMGVNIVLYALSY